jgi:hypothetical protein
VAGLHLFQERADRRRERFAKQTIQSLDDPSLPPVQQPKAVG